MDVGRYAAAPIVTAMVADGERERREVRYLGRRKLPHPRDTRPLALHTVRLSDRLDLVAAEHLGDPLAAWRIADANIALDPFQLTADDAEGDILIIPFPDAAP